MKKVLYSIILTCLFLLLNSSSCIKKDEDPTDQHRLKKKVQLEQLALYKRELLKPIQVIKLM